MNTILNPLPLFTAAALCFAASVPAAIPCAEKLLPDDTLAMITVPDTARLRDISQKSPMGQLWNDPAMKPFKDKFMLKFREELVAPLERELGVNFDDYAPLAQGQLTLALTANGWQGDKDGRPGVLFLLDARDKQPDLNTALAEFRKKWTAAGKIVRTEKVRDVEFMVVTLTTNDIPATLKRLLPGPSGVQEAVAEDEAAEKKAGARAGEKTELIIGRVDSLFIVGNTLKPIERIVGQLTGGSAPVLADVAQFQSCQPVFFREAHAFGWVNAKVLAGALAKVSDREEQASEEAPDPLATIRPGKILSAAGLSSLRNAAFAFQDSVEGPLLQFHLGVPEAERKGLLKILAGEAKEATPPPFVPADAVKFTRWRMDGQKSWATMMASLVEIFPTIVRSMDDTLNAVDAEVKKTDEKFDLRRQVIDNLGDDIISFEKKPRGTEPGQVAQPPSLTMIGSKQPAEMVSAIKVVFGMLSPDYKPSEREFLGRKIYSVTTMAGPQLDPTVPSLRKLHLSHSGGYVLVATDETVLEEFLRSSESQPKALRETPGLMEAAAKVTGPGTSVFGYENQLERQRAEFELLKQTLAAPTPPAPASGMTPIPESFGLAMPEASVKDWFDYSLLPPFEAIAKYYNFTVYGGGANVDGLTMKVFLPTPPALKK